MADLEALAAAIEAGDRATAVRITTEAVAEGMDPRAVLDAMTGAMEVIGAKFACNEIYVPEMLISARAMKEATAVLEPVLVAAGIKPEHTAVIGTIKGDLHDIGKNLVGLMLQGSGFEVVDLGADVKPERFVEAVKTSQPHFVMMSALLTTTMLAMKDTVEALKAANLRTARLLLVQAVPAALVLFLLFPRVQGPLWGLPQDAYAGLTGLSDSMTPGSLSQLILSDAIAFREFRTAVYGDDFADDALGDLTLALVEIEDRAAVLRAAIAELAVGCERINRRPECGQQLGVTGLGRVKAHLHRFNMASLAGGHLFVGWIGHRAADITGCGGYHTRYLVKIRLSAPEATTGKGGNAQGCCSS